MSKKRFSEGLDGLFSDAAAEQDHREDVRVPPTERKGTHKNFLFGLDALLQEALEESLEKYESNQPDTTTPSARTKSAAAHNLQGKHLTGLDSLIRQTIDVQEINTNEATGIRRLTVAVDRSKVEKLKTIARLENSYLKDLLVTLIDGYINEYTQQKGIHL